jgi:tetratricopeptide (TPR) repeat protein
VNDHDRIAGVYRNTQQIMGTNNNLLDTIHPDTPNNVTSISASLMWEHNEYEEADKASHKAVEGYKRRLDPDHPATLKCLRVLASLLKDQENYEVAEEMYHWLLKAYEKVLGRHDTQTVSIARELVVVLSGQGKYEAEEEMRRSILKTDDEVLGKEQPQTLKNLSESASVLRVQGKYVAAEAMMRLLLGRQVQALTAHHNSLSNIMYYMLLLSREGKPQEVENILRLTGRALQDARK